MCSKCFLLEAYHTFSFVSVMFPQFPNICFYLFAACCWEVWANIFKNVLLKLDSFHFEVTTSKQPIPDHALYVCYKFPYVVGLVLLTWYLPRASIKKHEQLMATMQAWLLARELSDLLKLEWSLCFVTPLVAAVLFLLDYDTSNTVISMHILVCYNQVTTPLMCIIFILPLYILWYVFK